MFMGVFYITLLYQDIYILIWSLYIHIGVGFCVARSTG